MIKVQDIKKNEEVKNFMRVAEMQLSVIGYTEHSFRHVGLVSKTAGSILESLGYSEREIELARIAGYLHDIGNSVNRTDHAHTGAILAYDLLLRMGMNITDASEVMLAIGQHDEKTGMAVSAITAAVILADKSDVHRSRVHNKKEISSFEIHDRVNYAVESSKILVDSEKKQAVLDLVIDIKICPIMDYFEIFLSRMTLCRRAADFLKLDFHLIINGTTLL
ncbi:MAG: HD domain-containing protein [Clostridia bacterium]|nr:HD domain-containing protein [Clostridia bacterium]